ncbi:hypothetical protein AVEN_189445-1 [Araneus ventricosus]|uniref:Uncharacterized protein n=1 Tax=Araneus ventricosus TaxID=182803 RepID=A0A4Y2EG65_ARAVE|nr:hypothetical protein AVEN_189445-1 [Araneus ventricosus]
MFWGFIAVVIRPPKQRVVEYRPKTHTQLQLLVGTALRSLSSPLSLTFRSFTDVSPEAAAIAQTLGLLEQGSSSVQSRAAILFNIFDGFGSPRKDGRNCIPLFRKGAVLVRDGYKRCFFLSFLWFNFTFINLTNKGTRL